MSADLSAFIRNCLPERKGTAPGRNKPAGEVKPYGGSIVNIAKAEAIGMLFAVAFVARLIKITPDASFVDCRIYLRK